MLALAVIFVTTIDILLTFIFKQFKSPSQAHKEILQIDQELKGLSETEDFVKWARLTRKRQELVKQNAQSEASFSASISKTISTISKLSKVLLFLLFRTSPIVTLDAELLPVAFAKALSFTGFSFIRYGDVSTFMFYFCAKSMSGKLLFDLRGLSPHAAAWQSRGGSVLALASKDSVKLWDRSGQLVAENAAKQALIAWDSDGQILSIIPSKSQSLTVLMMSNKQSRVIEFDLKDQLVCQAWSMNTNSLAIGTSKGSLILVDFKTDKKVPVLGKHGKKISHAVWSKDNRLALASIDGMISVNDSKGDLIVSQRLRAEPQDLQFGSMKSDQRSHAPDTISVLQEKRSIFLWRYEGEEQSELSFQASYGKIISYSWYGDGYLAIAFDTGRLIGVSTHIAEIGTEIFNIQDHSEFCSSMKLTNDGIKLATAGEDSIRVHSVANMKVTDSIIPIPDETAGGFRAIQWSDNGALIAALSNSGTIYVFLTELTVMGQSNGNKLAYLSSLSEMTLFEPNTESKKIKLGMEPSFVGLGPADLCYGFNNKAKFHQLDDGSLTEKEYVGSVKRVSVGNDYAVGLLSDGRLQLHLIVDDGMTPEKSVKIFPDGKSQDGNIIAAEIRGEMLIYATSGGKLRFFSSMNGQKTLLIDDVNKGYVYTAGDDTLMEVGELPGRVNGCLWDAVETHVFTVWDNQNQLVVFSVHDLHVEGQKVEQVAIGRKPKGQSPLLLSSGLLFLQTSSGKLNRITLPSHKGSGPAEMSDLENAIRLRNWPSAQEICAELDDPKAWNKAAEGPTCGNGFESDGIKNEEDIFYLRGACSVLLRNFDVAQKAFLQSSEPIAALELRRDLQHWEESLSLANRLAPERIPEIAREYAAQQEFEGNYSGALGNYERAIQDGAKTLSKEQLFLASSGIARCSLRMGDLRRGLQLANNSSSKVLKRECADILDKMKQYTQAGMLYVKGEFWEKAAASFLKGKESNRVAEIIDKVDAVKIHMAFAKTREAEGKIDEALTAYGRAGDEDARIRLLLSSGRTLEAEEIVKETGSLEGADRIARYYIKKAITAAPLSFSFFLTVTQKLSNWPSSTRKWRRTLKLSEIEGALMISNRSRFTLKTMAISYSLASSS
ncbi:Oidioi.mRNA.OKI2018_I69.PAR.g10846.t1.cds [Oikopleura dioica]|uniref:Oidioi.mRNA.OKI2018_I69.PAR.g10846.t1.cds n=1 Tax=Oikopleura dioica TaxID=34765 RepID=A0ABN7RW26_OIKDI|nr:Oidioi.mRNA.OKI2018_I69.PAR.g10846.t1.cds [Oikopleura dioica]